MANLGTAQGRIEIDGSGAARGFQVAEAAADSFFAAVTAKVGQVEALGAKMAAIGTVAGTGFGLAIAMPALVFYRHFRALVDSFIIDMELQAVKFVDVVHGARK